MEMANALLYIAGALMMVWAHWARPSVSHFGRTFFGRRRTPTRTDPHAAYPVLRGDGPGRRGSDDCRRYRDVHHVCGGELIRAKRLRIIQER